MKLQVDLHVRPMNTHMKLLIFPVASVPKRESSRRGAKDKVSQRIKSLHTGDDEEDIQDIDLEDSDDDASWTPFKVRLESPTW